MQQPAGMYLQRRVDITQHMAKHVQHHHLLLRIAPPPHVGCTAKGWDLASTLLEGSQESAASSILFHVPHC